MTVFDLLDTPLDGSNLIEASAGTGKTYNIVGLFVRLIVEKELRVNDILVVTYTTAATNELRERIRNQLVEAQWALDRGTSRDAFIHRLVDKIRTAGRQETAHRLLRAAIRDFDEAPIFTIHSFCLRMLQEHAFESGAAFDSELIPDEETILREFAQDFWRRHFYEAPLELVEYALGKGLKPDSFLQLLKESGNHALTDLVLMSTPPEMDEIIGEITFYHNLFKRLHDTWQQERDVIAGLLHRPGLNGRIYGKHVDGLLELLDTLFVNDRAPFPLVRDWEKITAGKITRGVNKGHVSPQHPFFDQAQQFQDQAVHLTGLCEDYLRYLRMEIVRQARIALPRWKEQRNILAYNDLLGNLFIALQTERGPALAREVRSRFQAVLIDEFQDTDPVQYGIFKTLFLAEEPDEQRPFFVIGDPKQAIYAFRGADIFAYIEASQTMQRRYTLEKNWRSEPDLLQAVNTLFSAAEKPFLYGEILYHPLVGADVPDRPVLCIDHRREPPFHWWLLPEAGETSEDDISGAASPTRGLHKGGLHPRVASAVASECARLIRLGGEGRAMLGDTPLHAGDLAVLVRTNREAEIMSEALTKRHIPYVLSSRESVFHSAEAREVLIVLRSIAEPKDIPQVRAALVTAIMGMTGDDLNILNTDIYRFEDILRRFHLYHALWENSGFIQMFRHFLDLEHIPSRTLKSLEGERRLTNLLHIGELLHQAATAEHLIMYDLIVWLDNQIKASDTQPEEYELRLERDEKAVKVVTIHKSKGLEYPVVFCPFSWGSSAGGGKKDHILFHDREHSYAPVIDFGSSDFDVHCRIAEEETLAEEIRLLYVALTRARHRTYFAWGRLQNVWSSAAAYLFHQGPAIDTEDIVGAVRTRYKALTAADFTQDVTAIVNRASGAIQLSPLPEAEEKTGRFTDTKEELVCRDFTGLIDQSWKTASYTFLVSSRYDERILDDTDQTPEREMTSAPEKTPPDTKPQDHSSADLFGFPGGTQAGILLHEILEQVNYRQDQSDINHDIIDEKLIRHGYASHWIPVLKGMVRNVTSCPLPAAPEGNRTLSLSQILPEGRRNEVEFYFPLRRTAPNDLARLFRQGATMKDSALSNPAKLRCLERLHFRPLEGYLKGYIDLLFCFGGRFYLADWKSNYLGIQPSDYGHEALQKVIDEGFYYIQYHLYALALHQYLKLRVPEYRYEDHFGGVYYLFLRGINPAWGNTRGIFYDRPPLELLNLMRDTLIRPPGM